MTQRSILTTVLILLLSLGVPYRAGAVDHSVVQELRSRAEPFVQITESQYLKATKSRSHPLSALRKEFAQFVASSKIEMPTAKEALAWREALTSPVIQQFALEWLTVAWALAELQMRENPPTTDWRAERDLAELQATRDAFHKFAAALKTGTNVPQDAQEVLAGRWQPPAIPLSPVCDPIVQAVRLLGHLAPETLKETIGIEHEKAELVICYLKEGTRSGSVPCGPELNELASDTVRLIWGRRDPSRANVSPMALMFTVVGSWKKSYADTDVHWNVLRDPNQKTSFSFKSVQEEWTSRWGVKFKRVRAEGITVR
jgi:hypothetical protein